MGGGLWRCECGRGREGAIRLRERRDGGLRKSRSWTIYVHLQRKLALARYEQLEYNVTYSMLSPRNYIILLIRIMSKIRKRLRYTILGTSSLILSLLLLLLLLQPLLLLSQRLLILSLLLLLARACISVVLRLLPRNSLAVGRIGVGVLKLLSVGWISVAVHRSTGGREADRVCGFVGEGENEGVWLL